MKKLICLILLIFTLVCAFAVSAMAADIKKVIGEDVEITGNESYDGVLISHGDKTVSPGKLTVKSGASLSVGTITGGPLIIEPDATVTVGLMIHADGNIEVGGKLQSESIWECGIEGDLIIEEGGRIDFYGALNEDPFSGITGKLNPYCYVIETIVLAPGNRYQKETFYKHLTATRSHTFVNGKCSVCGRYACEAKGIAHTFKNGKCTTCGYVCQNDFHNGVCPECGMVASASVGSVFSGGSLTVICTVAALAVGIVGGFFLGRWKKKPVAADGAADEDLEE